MTQTHPETAADTTLGWITRTIDDVKAVDRITLDVQDQSDFFDCMLIAGATSTQHAKAIARHLKEEAKHEGMAPVGIEGENEGEWVLLDFDSIIVHIMTAETRNFYQLEKLWGYTPGQ